MLEMVICVSFVHHSLVMLLFLICTANKAVSFLWLHKNNVYSIAVLEQLSRIVGRRGKLHVLKIQMDYLLSLMN